MWDAENRLSQVQDNNGDLVEQYWYDVGGARVKKDEREYHDLYLLRPL